MSANSVGDILGDASLLDIDALLDDRAIRTIVCCGAGGVGKTTTSAALALRAAELGRHVVVLTIDPARRLAQSMGLAELDNEPRLIPDIDSAAGGSLHAMMLDMKRTFDEIVERTAGPERAGPILANPFYRVLSTSFAGTQEYMAMEKLGQLTTRGDLGDWDLIIVDTPPSRSALDFLDAPRRLGSFLDSRFMRILAAPARSGGRLSMRLVSASFGVFTNVLTKILGGQLLRDLAAFVSAFDSVFGGFQERAERTFSLLQQPDTAFIVIASPERDALREASYFVERLAADDMPLAGLVLNRVQATNVPELSAEQALAGAERLEANSSHPVVATLLRLHAERMEVRTRQRHLAARFFGAHPDVSAVAVAALAGDVHDLPSLRTIGERLADRD